MEHISYDSTYLVIVDDGSFELVVVAFAYIYLIIYIYICDYVQYNIDVYV